MSVAYHPKVAKKNYDRWTKTILSELFYEDRETLYEVEPNHWTVEQNKRANNLILSTLSNERWCEDTLKKKTKEEYLKWRDSMIKQVHDSICFGEGFILSFYKWNKFFGVLEA